MKVDSTLSIFQKWSMTMKVVKVLIVTVSTILIIYLKNILYFDWESITLAKVIKHSNPNISLF